VQRRRRRKAVPKNVFGTSSQPGQKKKPAPRKQSAPTIPKPKAVPPSLPGAKPRTSPAPEPEPPVLSPEVPLNEPEISEDSETGVGSDETIVEQQLLGASPRKLIGLKREEIKAEPEIVEEPTKGTSEKARELIESSIERAMLKPTPVKETRTIPKSQTPAPPKKEIVKKRQRKFRSNKSTYQPATRAKRLDRSRHMEYKYEMRGLLVKLGIAEEFRSLLLATIWARGERQTVNEAKEFIVEKVSEGIIDQEQQQVLENIVDNYTIRR